MSLLYWLLLPFSLVFDGITRCRNWLFEHHYFLIKHYPLPVINVGNLAVGGTGKTPHTEYLIRLIAPHFQLCTLSRGYGRKSKGFRWVRATDTAAESGDEPLQMALKFNGIQVAVCENRCRGIEQILATTSPDVILLDDAFQHRYVQPSLNLLLTDYHRLYIHDTVLPAGRLRENQRGAKRADLIIVTKCPPQLSWAEKETIVRKLAPLPHQKVFFTCIAYAPLTPLFPTFHKKNGGKPFAVGKYSTILALTAIAHNAPFIEELKKTGATVETMAFPDHHAFSTKDLQRILHRFKELAGKDKVIVTTEKDAARLRTFAHELAPLQPFLWVLPITIQFLFQDTNHFNQYITHHINTFQRVDVTKKEKHA